MKYFVPPVVIPATGDPVCLDVTPAAPIGTYDHRRFPEHEFSLEHGATSNTRFAFKSPKYSSINWT